jgi:hypothetical protein
MEFQQKRAVLWLSKRCISKIKPAGTDANLKQKIVGCLKTEPGTAQQSLKIASINAGYDNWYLNKFRLISERVDNFFVHHFLCLNEPP